MNEIVDWMKVKEKLLIFKADFPKAYDRVSWQFFLNIMTQMNFGGKCCKWITGCLKSAQISVLISGSPLGEFNMERGLRQGDPISPFLFLIAGEALNIVMQEASKQKTKFQTGNGAD